MVRILILTAMLTALPLKADAGGVSVDQAEILMNEARTCAKAGDKLCTFERMLVVLRSDHALDALATQPQGARLHWLYFYRTGLEVVEAAPAEQKVDLADKAIALLEDRFPGQEDAAMVFHMMKAEAHADLGDLKGGADNARKAVASYMSLALMGTSETSLLNVDDVKARLALLQITYKGEL